MERHSSRCQPIDTGFLTPRLAGPQSYDRIAGYFSSSILEAAGEAPAASSALLRSIDSDR